MELTINLPDSLANEAKAAGLLTAEAIEKLLREAVRRNAVDELFDAMDRMADANLPPMTMEEIQAEVDAVRQARHERARRS
jgi:Arc/MetJ family transcription regulator